MRSDHLARSDARALALPRRPSPTKVRVLWLVEPLEDIFGASDASNMLARTSMLRPSLARPTYSARRWPATRTSGRGHRASSARPHPGDALPAAYGWGDWFVASLVASVVAWPVVFATDTLWATSLLPLAQNLDPGGDSGIKAGIAVASLVPKAAGSYFGTHVYVPKAWWFYKLTLLPALPISFTISLLVHFGTNNFTAEDGVPHALPEGINKPQEGVSSAWKPSTIEEKSTLKRLRDTAPTPIQIALKKLGV